MKITNIFTINHLAIIVALLLSVSVFLLVAPEASAVESSIRQGVGATGDVDGDAESNVLGAVATGIDIFSIIVGVISVIMIIIGGLKYITSAGDSSNITSAKNTILYAVIGLVIVVLAQAIVLYVLDEVGGSSDDDDDDSSYMINVDDIAHVDTSWR